MSNSYSTNPIVLDTFSSALDLGVLLFNNTNAIFTIESIEWQIPTNVTHTAQVTDANGVDVFNEQCTVANQSILKKLGGTAVQGLKLPVATSTLLASGKISILLSTDW
jgi:hypothetical protein